MDITNNDCKDLQKTPAAANADELAERTPPAEPAERDRRIVPAVDIVETAEALLLTADVPGLDESTLDLAIEKGVLTLTGLVDVAPEGLSLLYSEYPRRGRYERAFRLPEYVDEQGIEAAVKDGVLEISLPKAATRRARKIEVSTA